MTPAPLQPTTRFTHHAGNYARYRPSYPAEVLDFLQAEWLKKEWIIADIGSGTGIFSELLLRNGYTVYAVEPNKAMREEAEKNLAKYKAFRSINGKAEETFLSNNSVDLITVAQAFHWVDQAAAKEEFHRILKPGGLITILWNVRLINSPFLKALEELKSTFGTDYKSTRMTNETDIRAFFSPRQLSQKKFYHTQVLDYGALKGQLLSGSYVPLEGKDHIEMISALEQIFGNYNDNGLVKIEYETRVYVNN